MLPKKAQPSRVAVVPATREVSRFTSPVKVAVRPLNMKIKTLKKATTPKATPERAAQPQPGTGTWMEATKATTCRACPQPSKKRGEKKTKVAMRAMVREAAICSVAKKARLSSGAPLGRVFL